MFYAKDISIKIKGREIVKESSINVDDGEVKIFIGSNGEGKTTTIRGISGLIPLESGVSSLISGSREKSFGVSLGPEYLPNKITVRKFLNLTKSYDSINDNFEYLYKGSGLGEISNKRVSNLSTGMKQKLSIINAMRFLPDNILLDEPHSGLDPRSIEWLNEEINNLKKQGASILISSHLLREVSRIGDGAYKIDSGYISEIQWPIVRNAEMYVVFCNKVPIIAESLDSIGAKYRIIGSENIIIELPSEKIFAILNSLGATVKDFKEVV